MAAGRSALLRLGLYALTSPNSFCLPLGRKLKIGAGRRRYISWQSDNPVAVLALTLFVIDLRAMVLVGIIGSFMTHYSVLDETVKVPG